MRANVPRFLSQLHFIKIISQRKTQEKVFVDCVVAIKYLLSFPTDQLELQQEINKSASTSPSKPVSTEVIQASIPIDAEIREGSFTQEEETITSEPNFSKPSALPYSEPSENVQAQMPPPYAPVVENLQVSTSEINESQI